MAAPHRPTPAQRPPKLRGSALRPTPSQPAPTSSRTPPGTAQPARPARRPGLQVAADLVAGLAAIAVAGAVVVLSRRGRDERLGDDADADSGKSRRALAGRGRGKGAEGPGELPSPAWGDVLRRVKDQITQDRVMIVAAGVTFYAILSLFPLITAFVALYGLLADRENIANLLDGLEGAVPNEALVLISEQLEHLLAVDPGTLTLTSVIAIAVALWGANGGVKGLIEAMNVAYGEREERSFIKLNLVALSMTLGAMAMVAVLLGVAAVLPRFLDAVDDWVETLLLWGRWPMIVVILMLALAVLYRFGPDRSTAKWRWVTPGAVLASVGVLVTSAAFAFYTENFANYGDTYGSLGAVIAVMFWIWLSTIVVIVGAELNAETEHQTAEDTTIGGDQPLGQRGASMADQVAQGDQDTKKSPDSGR
jgi:membrane protein